MKIVYIDTSAFLKLVVAEPESSEFRAWLRGREWTSSVLLRIEAERGASRHTEAALHSTRKWLERINLIRLSSQIVDMARRVEPPSLRTLDAIHLATALHLGRDLVSMVTYDRKLAEAARALAINVPELFAAE
ncbi:MAG: type II toxin-antitoxin system VapC family toxin [Candidatus Dormibacteraceae bacterium]